MRLIFQLQSYESVGWVITFIDLAAAFCLESRLAFSGQNLSTLTDVTPNPWDCRRECQKNPACTHFTWRAIDNYVHECQLKGGDSGRTAASDGYLSGPKECPPS